MVVSEGEVALSLEIDSAGQRAQMRRAALASSIGTTIEWYDFFLAGRRYRPRPMTDLVGKTVTV